MLVNNQPIPLTLTVDKVMPMFSCLVNTGSFISYGVTAIKPHPVPEMLGNRRGGPNLL